MFHFSSGRLMTKQWVRRAMSTLSSGELLRINRLKDSLENLRSLQHSLVYSCDTGKLHPDIRPCFVELSANLKTLQFLRENQPHPPFKCWMRSVLGIFLSNTNANTLLGMYKMHVLDTSNARRLLELPLGDTLGSLLDIGAGDGNVTMELSPLFNEVLATEASYWCTHRLKEKGIPCKQIDDVSTLPSSGYDVVSCLNVLDRCSHPHSLLREIRRLLRPGTGRALLAVVLPFQPFVEAGSLGHTKPPVETLGLDPFGGWEESVNRLATEVLRAAGLEVVRVARVPYLCQGDMDTPYYSLDDAVFVLQAAQHPPAEPVATHP